MFGYEKVMHQLVPNQNFAILQCVGVKRRLNRKERRIELAGFLRQHLDLSRVF